MHERKLAEMEKKSKAALDEAEKQATRQINQLKKELDKASTNSSKYEEEISTLSEKISQLKSQVNDVGALEEEVTALRSRAAEADEAQASLKEVKHNYHELEGKFKQEQALRKKYYNIIEDMKGKIRVYARCRPLSGSELERGNSSVVRFVDEVRIGGQHTIESSNELLVHDGTGHTQRLTRVFLRSSV